MQEKLKNIYEQTDCHKMYSTEYLDLLYNFIIINEEKQNKYLNPYEFAYINKISIKSALTFFLYFTNDSESSKQILNIELFFECTNNTCDSSIFLKECELDEGVYECSNCYKDYLYEDIKPFIKAYFTLNEGASDLFYSDPNSTMNILERLPDNLKEKSPSFINNSVHGEGDNQNNTIFLNELLELNRESKVPITNKLTPYERLMHRL